MWADRVGSVHCSLMDSWAVSMFWPLWIVLLGPWVYECLSEPLFSILWGPVKRMEGLSDCFPHSCTEPHV